jgi:tRNA threonylcarbamoyl adenosine modification protein YeaZ
MKILGIDTTTKFLSLCLYEDGKIYEYNLDLGRKHSTLLIVTIKRVLAALGWQIEEIDYFACGLGPGSFTGIRVGLATIKGLAFSLNKPIIGISTLDLLAKNVKAASGAEIIPAIDAKRNLIYCSVYRLKAQKLKRITPYLLLSEKELLRKIRPQSVLLGDALILYKEKILKSIKGVNMLSKDYWYPQPRNLIALALEKIQEKKFSRALAIKPIYLYPKECQIKKHGK